MKDLISIMKSTSFGNGGVVTIAARAIIYSLLISRSVGFVSLISGDLKLIREKFLCITATASVDPIQEDIKIIRELGGYERLLSRKTPGTDTVSLSHGSAFIFDGSVTNDILLEAVALCMEFHPLLRTFISKDDTLKKEYWAYCERSNSVLAQEITSTVQVSENDFDSYWKTEMERAVNDAHFPEKGPLWRLKNIVSDSPLRRSAWVFCFNHGGDDQQSVNIIVKELLEYIHKNKEEGKEDLLRKGRIPFPFPKCIEEAIAPDLPSWNTAKWGIYQLGNQAAKADILPSKIMKNLESDPTRYGKEYVDPNNRKTFLEYLSLSKEETANLLSVCRSNGVTPTNALSAAILSLTSSFFQNEDNTEDSITRIDTKNLRFLLSVGLRAYGQSDLKEYRASVLSSKFNSAGSDKKVLSDWTGGTVACASGAVDFVVSVPASVTMKIVKLYADTKAAKGGNDKEKVVYNDFWKLAKRCNEKSKNVIEKENFVPESVRLFGLGMKYVDILKVVEQEAKNPATMGRGYSCGVSNVGLVKLPTPSEETGKAGKKEGTNSNDMDLRIKAGYYGTSHARNGVYCLLSSMTIGDTFCGCLQFTSPFITIEEAALFRTGLVKILCNLY